MSKMRFVLNDNVYCLEDLSEVQSALGLKRTPHIEEDVLAVLFLMTKQALMQNVNTLLTLATNTSDLEDLEGNIFEEIQEFRNFVSAVESANPSVSVRAEKLLEETKDGDIFINGQEIKLIMEKKDAK